MERGRGRGRGCKRRKEKNYNEFVGETQVASRVCNFFSLLLGDRVHRARCMLCATFRVFIEACGNEKVERTCKEERDYRSHGSQAAPVHTRFVRHVENTALWPLPWEQCCQRWVLFPVGKERERELARTPRTERHIKRETEMGIWGGWKTSRTTRGLVHRIFSPFICDFLFSKQNCIFTCLAMRYTAYILICLVTQTLVWIV